MLRLLIGTDWVCIRNEILRRIASDVKAQRPGRILMVPELISHDMERRLCAAAGDTASRFAVVLSFTRLARRVSDSVGAAAEECLDNGGRVVAMAAAARQLHSRLKAYAAVETKPEFLTELVDAVDEFKRCCITAEDLRLASEQTEGTLAQKLEELSLLLSAYDSLCARGKRDPRDQMTWLLEQLADGSFAADHVFYIDGFPDFTRQHLAILEHLIGASEDVTVGLNCDGIDSKALAFEKAGQTAAELIRCARNAGVAYEIIPVSGRHDDLSAACAGLFQGALPSHVNGLTAIQAQDPYEEVCVAAQKVMELVRSGSRYRDIAIVCPDMAANGAFLKLHFHQCGIPLYLSGTEDILQKTVISTVLAALDAALDGFEQRSVLRYLKSILSPLDPDTCDRVENYAVLWGIRGKLWQETWTRHPGGLGQDMTPAAENRLAMLNAARSRALDPLFRLSEGFRNATKLSEQVDALYAFLNEIHLDKALKRLAEEMDGAGDNRSAQILNQLWEILLGALQQMRDVLGDTVWEPDVFTRLLTLLLSQYDVGTIPPVLDAVTAGTVSAMRCQQTKHLIVLGASEGALPGYPGSTGLLSDQERTTLRSLGVPLTGGAMEGIQAEFAEIYGVFCGASETVTVSCSAQPSYVFKRLADMAGGVLKPVVDPGLACGDERDVGAFLAKWKARAEAAELGVEDFYADTRNRAEHSLGCVSREHIQKLYGSRLYLSASQIDRQAECRLSYFLKYGMGAKERKEATVDPAEFGTYVHAVLEKTAAKVMELGGFHSVSLEQTMDIAMEYSDEYVSSQFSQIDSQRLSYLFRRNRRELEMVVEELWQELKQSEFMPHDFELSFGDEGRMPAIEIPASGMEAALRGFVDRVDIWQENGKHYFRVVDYKTGKKDFDYCDVFNGVGLQMLLYLFALEQSGAGIVGNDPIAAGVQYFPARAPLLSADGRLTDEEAEKLRQKEWKRRGLLLRNDAVLRAMDPDDAMPRLCCTRKKDGTVTGDLADSSQLKLLRQYMFVLLSRMVDDIASGNVQPNPYTRGTAHNACAFCPYGSICHPDSVEGRRNYKTMEPERFWDEISTEVEHHG